MFVGGCLRRYLLIITNNAESRATGGFTGSYAVITAENGKLTVGDILRRLEGQAFGGDRHGLLERDIRRETHDQLAGLGLGDQRAQRRLAGAARELHPVAVADAAILGVMRMDLEPILLVPHDVGGAPRLQIGRAHV